ncbi:MAG TPA: cell division protein FtsA [Patescibacteria group bacterium]|nr:cell division protein FtsA [Patescibacteria group bacterium]
MKKETKADSAQTQNPTLSAGGEDRVQLPANTQKTQLKPAGRNRQENLFSRNIIAAIDIGSSKVVCFIAEIKSHGTIEVIGIGHQASKGVKAGVVIDLKAAETAVAHAVEAAETMAKGHLQGQPIRSVFVNVPGGQTLSHRLPVNVKISGHEVSERDVRNALSQSRNVTVQGRDELIHVIAAQFSIDKQKGIAEPVGMTGQSLDVILSPVTAMLPTTRNIATVLHHNHIEIDGYCATPYAAGLATLVEDEKNLGCTVIDMGGGSTNIGVFYEGKLIYTSAVALGGHHVTSDIAIGLTTSLADAERIKTLYGAAQSTLMDDTATIDVPPVGEEEHSQPNYVPKSYLSGIIQPRIEETFEHVRAKLVDHGIDKYAGRRVVLTGGASQLPGLTEIAKLILDKQVRLGRPQKIKGLAEATGGPAFSAAAGLLHYAAEHAEEIPRVQQNYGFNFSIGASGNVLQKVTHWLKENW